MNWRLFLNGIAHGIYKTDMFIEGEISEMRERVRGWIILRVESETSWSL